ncbi:MFS transporter [Mobiluncus sp.]|uniref:MFS transporter n=1 Tax=Mobiluncus sp. TaxID=47293 RepID=UPI002A91A2F2|nr:MFS transporter [Mobiluncus sp.]MDY6076855.1 MFS transporter [Mobiluncus sp.]
MTNNNQPEKLETDDVIVRRALTCSFLGNFAEWLDYGSYAYLATVIAVVFFPEGDPAVTLMSTYAVFALSFVARPIGAFVWGYLGDKKGRKWSLTVSILLMTAATSAIGLIPSFNAIGYAAPILLLLLRLLQGFSASAEYAGAAVFIAEYAPKNKRGLYCSLVPASTATGLLVGSFLATVLNATLSAEMMQSFGWRIPFLLAFPLGVVVLRMWLKLEDSEIYRNMVKNLNETGQKRKSPLRLLFTKYWRQTLISFGVSSLNAVGFYMVLTYLPVYVETVVKLNKVTADLITNATLVLYISMIFFAGKLSDHFGRKKLLISACLGFIVLIIPGYMLLNTKIVVVILIVELVLAFVLTLNDGTLSSFLSETFPTEVRYSGFAVSFNLANAIFGGTVGLVSTFIIKATGNPLSPAFYMVGVSFFALVCMVFAKEYKDKELR